MTRQRYIALLRGINVGRAKRIAMADLRQLVGELGCTEVRTLLNSGNVVFSAPRQAPAALAALIQDALVLKLGVAARVMVLVSDELDRIVAANPLLPVATDHARLLVFVFSDPGAPLVLAPLAAATHWAPEQLAVAQQAAYLWCPDGVLDSKIAAAMGKLLGDGLTARNWNTVCKLQALCADSLKA
ncbi:DUF1697 domain-containing protein [Massilia sp. P8910]|uniref:DUF1697 domain-containing protein n=1 Tax=Massilia antarctica TaxID=2765360 RepID=UPI0006BB71EC|nr:MULTISPECIES: DUF1697 domain-containing protein [Massilia]MCE3605901.1 DUF1697 domain-containing protein [Massilia antarctica]MCY0910966.1 DUF1697 domain-containing protein [Massilia sp. H27-R4]CUI09758.1 hypothetical protein BN2497_14293 [Janthinobacterium sp. CG23_2]CUU33544.1 hypothetical protein BN3177_14293 [Janthinobacterium sp. CG23_2]